MSREIRRIKRGWNHPICLNDEGYIRFRPLFSRDILEHCDEGRTINEAYLMPEWTEEEKELFAMYETVSEGTPISPPFETAEDLARWLANTGASAFDDMTATYEEWLRVCKGGYAPTAVIVDGRLMSGVAGIRMDIVKNAYADVNNLGS